MIPSLIPDTADSIRASPSPPGLIDAHIGTHAGAHELAQSLKFGVATVLDMFKEPDHVS